MPNWTAQQQDAISDRGRSLIVCAAAGSGKTAVLVERIVRLVCEGCPIDEMLVVTFTNAASSEMRARIGEALSKAARERPELSKEMLALSRASISTLHRFCGNLLREHFEALGLDPAFRIGDESECGVLSRQAMEDALYACYDDEESDFLAADAAFTQDDITEIALRMHAFMMTRPDPWDWLSHAEEACDTDAKTLADSTLVAMLLGDAKETLESLHKDALRTLELCRMADGPSHYAAACEMDAAMVEKLKKTAEDGYEEFAGMLHGVSFAMLGRKKKTDVFSEELAEQVKAHREILKRQLKAIQEHFALSLTDAADDLQMTRAPLRGLTLLLRKYDELYSLAKHQRNILDFNDLEHLALSALKNEQVCLSLRERYRYIFIDEYQDSSAIQEAIIGSFAREDNLFLVGDVKQSIYRFRQAEPTLFLEKAERFDRDDEPLSRRIDLQMNFRSRANVLAGVNAVFEHIMRRDATEIEYDERERLIPGLPVREDDPPLELHLLYKDGDERIASGDERDTAEDAQEQEARELANTEKEAMIAAARIKVLVGTPFYDAKSGGERALCYRDMAILMRTARRTASLAADILQAEGIPVYCDAGEGYFDIPEIRQMMALLGAVASGAKDDVLIAALRGPALSLTDDELARIRIHTPDSKTPYREAVRAYRDEMDDELAEKLREFEAKRNHWRVIARHQGAARLIEQIYADTNFLAQAGAMPGGRARQANLHLLTTRARTFANGSGGSLSAFLRYAERLRAGGDSMSASAIGESEDVVRIMTTHKSKGLEFPVVFVLGMGRAMNGRGRAERVLMDGELGIGLPCADTRLSTERDTILRRAIRLKTSRQQLAEEVRILYVAMTRARERLILIGDTGKETPPESWSMANGAARLREMRTPLDMVCPTLMASGATLWLPEETVQAGESRWIIITHRGGEAAQLASRNDEAIMQMIARLDATSLEDDTLANLISFSPAGLAGAVRKTTVSAILRDEKRAGEDEIHAQPEEPERLPRFMMEKRMTGAQIGTAFHRMMRMLSLSTLRKTMRLEDEIAAQLTRMLEDGIITDAEQKCVPPFMLTRFFASTVGVQLLSSSQVEREWAFTWRRTKEDGTVQLLQGVVDCAFLNDSGEWILVDYKTDAAKTPEEIEIAREKHRPQLKIYAEALASLTGRNVARRVIYLVRAGLCCEV